MGNQFATRKQEQELTAVVTEWQKLFGHLVVWDGNFNEANYPLGADPGDEAEEVGLDEVVTGHKAVAEFERLKRQPASLWAQGRYIKAHPTAQKDHPLVGIGAQRQYGSIVYFPFFYWYDGKPDVSLRSLGYKFGPGCHFLLRKET